MKEGEGKDIEGLNGEPNFSDLEWQVFLELRRGSSVCFTPSGRHDLVQTHNLVEFHEEDAVLSGEFIRYACIHLHRFAAQRIEIVGARIEGSIILEGLSVPSPLHLLACDIHGEIDGRYSVLNTLDLTGSTVHGLIDFRGATIENFVFLRHGFVAKSPVLFRDAKIGKLLVCFDCSFEWNPSEHLGQEHGPYAKGECFSIARAQIETFEWRNLRSKPKSVVNFTVARIHFFRDAMVRGDYLSDWPEKGRLKISGFTYSLKNYAPLDHHREWLALQDKADPQAHHTMRLALTNMGSDWDADEIFIGQRWLQLRTIPLRGKIFSRLLMCGYGLFSGFGYRPGRVLAWLLLALCLTALYGEYSYYRGDIRPSHPIVTVSECYKGHSIGACKDWVPKGAGDHAFLKGILPEAWHKPPDYSLPPEYPSFNSLAYATDILVPFFQLDQATYWTSPRRPTIIVETIIATIGYLLGSLLIISLTTVLLRGTRSS